MNEQPGDFTLFGIVVDSLLLRGRNNPTQKGKVSTDVSKNSSNRFLIFFFLVLFGIVLLPAVILSFVFSIYVLTPIVVVVSVLLYFFYIVYKSKSIFWQKIAERYGWEYSKNKNTCPEKALLFKHGHSRFSPNCISGNYASHPVSIFEYQYTIGSGKHSVTYFFTVYEIKFQGIFPHIFLNYKADYRSHLSNSSDVTRLPLPNEFEKVFDLYSPKKYEIEALEIFTPDILEFFVDKKWNFDVEFVDSEMIIYSRKMFSSFNKFDNDFNNVKQCVDLLSSKLNRFKFSQVGDRPHNL